MTDLEAARTDVMLAYRELYGGAVTNENVDALEQAAETALDRLQAAARADAGAKAEFMRKQKNLMGSALADAEARIEELEAALRAATQTLSQQQNAWTDVIASLPPMGSNIEHIRTSAMRERQWAAEAEAAARALLPEAEEGE